MVKTSALEVFFQTSLQFTARFNANVIIFKFAPSSFTHVITLFVTFHYNTLFIGLLISFSKNLQAKDDLHPHAFAILLFYFFNNII